MTESAGMDIYVRQKGIDGATVSLQKLAKSAEKAEDQAKKLGYFFDKQGKLRHSNGKFAKSNDEVANSLRKLKKDTDNAAAANKKLGNSFTETGTAMEAVRKIAVGYFSMSMVRNALSMADSMTVVRAQVQLVTSSYAESIAVQERLIAVSNKTYASLEATATLYTRTARALKDANKSQAELLTFTEAINNAMRLGGANANEQANALLQLSQALGSGVLQGDEFRSIAENAPILLDLVAKELGVVRGEVKQLASEGKVTSDVIFNALTNASGQLARDAATMPITLGQAMNVAKNELSLFTDTMLNSTGVTSLMADAILGLSKNVDFVLVPAIGLGAVFAVRAFGASLVSLGMVGGPIALAVAALGTLLVIFERNSRKLDEMNGKIESAHINLAEMARAQLVKHQQDIDIAITVNTEELEKAKNEAFALTEKIKEQEKRYESFGGKNATSSLGRNAGKTLDNLNSQLVDTKSKIAGITKEIDNLNLKSTEAVKLFKQLSLGEVPMIGAIGALVDPKKDAETEAKYSKEYLQILGEIEKKKATIGVKTLEQTISLKLQGKEYEKMDQLEKDRLIAAAANTDLMTLQAQNTENVTGMMEDLRVQAQKTGMSMKEAFLFDLARQGGTIEAIEEAKVLLDHIANNTPTSGKSSIDHYNDRLQDMSRELSEIISFNKELEATGYTSQYNAVSRITLELNDQSSTLSKISEAQKQILIDQAQQIDNANQLNAILNFSNDYSRRFEDMEFELELMGKTKREIEGMRFAYELEKQAKQMSIGMSRANIETLKSETEEILKQHSAYRQAEAMMDGSYFEGIKTGFADYIDSVGNVREQTAGAITMTFGHLESQLVNFAQTSKFSFSDMTSSILQDLSKILIRMGMMNMVVAGFGENGTGGFFGSLFKEWGWFADGGYTGHGGVHQPAGVVHKGEVVFSQRDITRLGGVGVVEGLRTSGRLPGYSSGGVVGAPPKFIPNIPSSQQGQQKSGDIIINQTIHYQGDKGEEDGKNAGQDFAAGFKTEVRRILADEKRPGGMLYR